MRFRPAPYYPMPGTTYSTGTQMNNKTQLTPEQLQQWQQQLERDTKYFQWIMVGGIFGGFAMVAGLGIWVYLAHIL